MTEPKLAVVAAGGTGGHLFPAQALAQVLVGRGWRVVLATDERVQTLSQDFPAERRIPLSAATFKPGDPLGMVKAAGAILKGVMQARSELSELKPAVVVGFGGYPSLPALMAAVPVLVLAAAVSIAPAAAICEGSVSTTLIFDAAVAVG